MDPDKIAEARAINVAQSNTDNNRKQHFPMVKAGHLYKKGAERHNWNKRWFELRTHSLAYYPDRKVRKKIQYLLFTKKINYFFLKFTSKSL